MLIPRLSVEHGFEDVWPRDQPLLRYKSRPSFQQYSGGCNGKGDERVPGSLLRGRKEPFPVSWKVTFAITIPFLPPFHNEPNTVRRSALVTRFPIQIPGQDVTFLFSSN
jgi:hypothetical protein